MAPSPETGCGIRSGQSTAVDPRIAVRELYDAINQPRTELVLFFCSSLYPLEIVAEEMRNAFAGTPVVGCTTAGEIGPKGYLDHSISGVSLSADVATIVHGPIARLAEFAPSNYQGFSKSLLQSLKQRAPSSRTEGTCGLLLIDGLSVREEIVVRTLQDGLGGVPLVGGSAGDDLAFSKTLVYFDGAFHDDAAVVVLAALTRPFRTLKTQHFRSLTQRMVVTAADPALRTVHEINGLPAAAEYARLVGIDADRLNASSFAAYPIVTIIDGQDYVRSIQKVNPDGSLTFYSAIEEGLVLRTARGLDLVGDLDDALTRIRAEIGAPALVIGCDCILRKLELNDRGTRPAADELLRANNVVGFSTYGEQVAGVHVNQTFTAIAIADDRASGGRHD